MGFTLNFLQKINYINILLLILVIISTILIAFFVKKFLNKKLSKSKVHISVKVFMLKAIMIVIYMVGVLTVISILGIPIASIIALLGAFGFALGLALKDNMANFASGIIIITMRPFIIGDYIQCEGFQGTVKDIQSMYTYLNTPDNKVLIIPNFQLTSTIVVNYTSESERRVDIVIHVDYEESIDRVKEIIKDEISKNILILQNESKIIRVNDHSEIGLIFDVKVWCLNKDYYELKYDLLEIIKNRFDKEGVKIPRIDFKRNRNLENK